MKKSILATIFSLIALCASADDSYSLYVVTAAGQQTYELTSLQRITFKDGNVVVETKSGESSSVAIGQVERMYFDVVETGINIVDNGKLAIETDDVVYDLQGRRVADNTQLPKGLYIVAGKKVLVK